MKRLLPSLLFFALAGSSFGQFAGLTLPPSGNNQKSSVSQYIGPVQVTVEYSSPAVHAPNGTDRRGQIWGKLVPYGMTDLGFNGGKTGPWRAGANENTVFAVSQPVTIEGQQLPAGRYGLHMIAGKDEWTIIFSKNSSAWGSFAYDESDDALRVNVKPAKHEYREWLTYEFTARKPSEATVELQWEELSVPWKIGVDNITERYVTALQKDLTGANWFDYRAYDAAAQYTVQTGSHLDLGLKWADTAINKQFIGQANFGTLSTKALVLTKMGRPDEAKTLMQTALKLPGTTPLEIHQYGRTLLNAKQSKEALEVFKYNAERNGDTWPVHVGLARGYAAVGDTQQALEHAKKAAEQAPDDLNRQSLQAMIKNLSEGKNNIN
jgi:hypothetical protein